MLAALVALGFGAATTASAQSSIEMEMLRENVQTDKQRVIEANLELTAAEAAEFWPIYDEFQTEIEVINSRIGWLIRDFNAAYNSGTFSEEQAETMLDEALAIDEDDADIRKKFTRQFSRVLPAAKVLRYMQIENKIRAVLRFDLAINIPVAE